MSLIFSSGGGRLGNQLLNLIHLYAISYEYNIDVYKFNDNFIKSNKKLALIYKIDRDIITWKIVSNKKKIKSIEIFFYKIFLRFSHLYFFFIPNFISYKIGSKKNLPKFIIGEDLAKGFSVVKLIKKAEKNNIIIAGWGLRYWDIVLKHKNLISKSLRLGFCQIKNYKKKIEKDYLFVHIRRSDFLDVDEFKDLNFSDQIWLKSIINICNFESISKVVIFSDSNIDSLISLLKNERINVSIANSSNRENISFIEQFVYYLSHAKAVVCNASTLVLSISFLYQETIYLPSVNEDYQNVLLNDAHQTYPALLNWN